MEKRVFRPGERIFRFGEASDNAYLITRGLVEISCPTPANDHVTIMVACRGDLIGAISLLDGTGVRVTTARVVEECEVVVLDPDVLARRFASLDPLVRNVVQQFIRTMKRQSQTIVERTRIRS